MGKDNKRKHIFEDSVQKTFDSPEKLPANTGQADVWQEANSTFWESNPMRYDWNQKISHEEGSKQFFEEIDKRFFEAANAVMPCNEIPFDNLIPYESLRNMRVLEIGVGIGSHASLIAPRALSYTGIDLTEYSVRMTSLRMDLSKLNADIMQMDAENLKFPDNSFDFIWSWGVIHHSSNTWKILEEIHRVLKPGGSAVIMVYHRGWWNYYITGGLFHGILNGGFFRHRSLTRVIQAKTDGALARYYSQRTWMTLAGKLFSNNSISISGNKADLFPLPAGRVKKIIMNLTPDTAARFFLGSLNMGSFLISKMVKE